MEYKIENPTDEFIEFLMGEANCDVDGYENHYIISGDSEHIEHIIDLEKRIYTT